MSSPVFTLQAGGDSEAGLRSVTKNADSNHLHGRREDDEEEGPSQFAALALGKENNVITTRCSSGLQEPDPGCHLTAVDGRVMCDVMPIDDAVLKLGCRWGK